MIVTVNHYLSQEFEKLLDNRIRGLEEDMTRYPLDTLEKYHIMYAQIATFKESLEIFKEARLNCES